MGDNVAVVIIAQHLDEINNMFYITFEGIHRWINTVSQQLAKHKTKAVLMPLSRKVIETIKLKVGEQKNLITTVHSIQESWRKAAPVYRLSAIRVTSAFRTISEEAVCVISGTLPLRVLLCQRKKLTILNPEVLSTEEWWHSISRWQNSGIMQRKMLSGHSAFEHIFTALEHNDSPEYPSCLGVAEDAKHVTRYRSWDFTASEYGINNGSPGALDPPHKRNRENRIEKFSNLSEVSGNGHHAQQVSLDVSAEIKRTQALKRLGKFIDEHQYFLQTKLNVYKEIKAKSTGTPAPSSGKIVTRTMTDMNIRAEADNDSVVKEKIVDRTVKRKQRISPQSDNKQIRSTVDYIRTATRDLLIILSKEKTDKG
ncbi:hypothetical protein EVAR_5817_1 [Eumeta japonica]|uniref:Uncharacterized protein n=1 Tax=Eumeta variegata TaxID=151549 RepID=A0A4C1T4D9_EUMVA|nr:hypothetical protein EVAR_5817_1 [Eumeta japonica]